MSPPAGTLGSSIGGNFDGFVVRVMRDQLPSKGLRQNGLVEPRQKSRSVRVLGGNAIEPSEGGLDAADNFLLLWSPQTGNGSEDIRRFTMGRHLDAGFGGAPNVSGATLSTRAAVRAT